VWRDLDLGAGVNAGLFDSDSNDIAPLWQGIGPSGSLTRRQEEGEGARPKT
jgi:hypothetical protein